MHSIYIQVPFCLQKCLYCSFYSVTDLTLLDAYLKTLIKEIKSYSKIYKNSIIKTIYVGGGTPSLLTPEQLAVIVNQLRTEFKFAADCEISLEVNPETVTVQKFTEYKRIGINRISVGVQSFLEEELRYLGRVHSADKAEQALRILQAIFENLNIDLIYCLPEQNAEALLQSLAKAIAFSPQHISCYELTYEPGTPLFKERPRQNELDYEFYYLVKKTLEETGYQQYEISNYARPGFICRHNWAYWSDQSYLGLGPGAHSYDREKNLRWANAADLSKYLNLDFPGFKEEARAVEKIIMGLRKNEGVSETVFSTLPYRNVLQRLIKEGSLEQKNGLVCFTEKGRIMANQVLLEFVD